jgi:hypothetical protein
MASSNLAQMQAAYNRIATVGNLGLVTVDGGMGVQTAEATRRGLVWISQGCITNDGNQCADVFSPDAIALISAITDPVSGAVNQTAVMQNNTQIAQLFNQAADTAGAPPAPPLVVVTGGSGGGGSNTQIIPQTNAMAPGGGVLDSVTGLWAKFKLMPTWQQAAIAAGLGLGVMAISRGISKRNKSRA